MDISKLKALFIQIDTSKNGSIEATEMQKSAYGSIFSGYFKGGAGVSFETFSAVLSSNTEKKENSAGSNKAEQSDLSAGDSNLAQETSEKFIQRQVPYFEKGSVELTNIPQIPENPNDMVWWGRESVDLRGNDASKLDLSTCKDVLLKSDIDTNTKFPTKDKLPPDYDPQKIIENGKPPGLGFDKLHQQGHNGEGQVVAISDYPIVVTHSEFKDNIMSYQEMGVDPNHGTELHGFSTTSILAGKTVGVAPKAKVVYFAEEFSEKNPATGALENSNKYVIQTLNKISEMNKTLPKDKQIKAVSLSWGPNMKAEDYKTFMDSVKKLEDSGVFVQYSDDDNPDAKLRFAGLDRDPQGNPDDVSSYKLSKAFAAGMDQLVQNYGGNVLLIPAGHRTTAAPTGQNDYVNYAKGGVSWQIPYIVGVYTIAKQANPNLTPDEFRKLSVETGTPYYSPSGQLVGKIINPENLLNELSKKK